MLWYRSGCIGEKGDNSQCFTSCKLRPFWRATERKNWTKICNHVCLLYWEFWSSQSTQENYLNRLFYGITPIIRRGDLTPTDDDVDLRNVQASKEFVDFYRFLSTHCYLRSTRRYKISKNFNHESANMINPSWKTLYDVENARDDEVTPEVHGTQTRTVKDSVPGVIEKVKYSRNLRTNHVRPDRSLPLSIKTALLKSLPFAILVLSCWWACITYCKVSVF